MLHRKTVLLVLVIIAMAAVSASAVTQHNELTGTLGTVDLDSTVTYDSGTGLWTYSYDMYNRTGNVDAIHVFVMANPALSPFEQAGNDSAFVDPASSSDPFLQWLGGSIELGAHGSFSYQSTAAPDIVNVDALVIDGGTVASGQTLGMSAAIPEPSCLASLAGLLGMTGFYLRRRRK